MSRLTDIFENKEENYILPFFWQHGNHTERLPEEVKRVYSSGVRSLCVESRPHPDFGGDGWWRDMDIIISECGKLGMKVWLLDDKSFPTGYANGIITKHPELRGWNLSERHTDVIGPLKNAALLMRQPDGVEEKFIGAFMLRRSGKDEEMTGEPIDLTANVSGNFLYLDVPEGCYRVFFVYMSHGFYQRPNYVSMFSKESAHLMIEAVYQPMFEHYGKEFGKTFVGFFSDEPEFGNDFFGQRPADYGIYDRRIGIPALALPWNDDFKDRMEKELGYDPTAYIPELWYRGDRSPELRLAYMNAATGLYRDCFAKQIGDWCHDHGVLYIGHVIEDMNVHARMGFGAGHYFRALAGQDWSGIDIVLHQVMPGLGQYKSAAINSGGVVDPEFFHYGLAQLASSLADIDPHKNGRAMCEVFGAFGWGEGSIMEKWLIDFLFVRGVNRFVPHAFSPDYPDPDCPPHFGAEGHDPQFDSFCALMKYTNKMAHILSGGTHDAPVAVLYHAEAEWMSERGVAMLMQKPAKVLIDDHIGCDYIWEDALAAANVSNGKLHAGNMTFGAVVVPETNVLPDYMLCKLNDINAAGVPVFYVNLKPAGASGRVVPLENIAKEARKLGICGVSVKGDFPLLRVFHTVRGKDNIFMIFNESTLPAECEISLPVKGKYALLKLLEDVAEKRETADGCVSVKLLGGESEVLYFAEDESETDKLPEEKPERTLCEIRPVYKIEKADSEDLSKFEPYTVTDTLFDFNAKDRLPGFCGLMRYTFEIDREAEGGDCTLDLGQVGQNARVTVNGCDAGIRIAAPYTFEIGKYLVKGKNEITVTAANTLVGKNPDPFSFYLTLEPSGVLGPVKIG